MKTTVTYECEGCGKTFTNRKECIMHEACHYPLNIGDYTIWQHLKDLVMMYNENNDLALLEKYTIDLIKFEEAHNLAHSELTQLIKKKE